jgi:hypothetical protein
MVSAGLSQPDDTRCVLRHERKSLPAPEPPVARSKHSRVSSGFWDKLVNTAVPVDQCRPMLGGHVHVAGACLACCRIVSPAMDTHVFIGGRAQEVGCRVELLGRAAALGLASYLRRFAR